MTSSVLSRLPLLLVSLLFWRKKPRQYVSDSATAASAGAEHLVNESDASRSREILRVLKLEREIIGSALTTIYESEAQQIITREERDRLIDKYSSDLKQLDSRILGHQRIVDIFDLEAARKELVQDYRDKLSEIDKKLADFRHGSMQPSPLVTVAEPTSVPSASSVPAAGPAEAPKPVVRPEMQSTGSETRDARLKTEKKIEAIKEEVLKAMERLEQIESED